MDFLIARGFSMAAHLAELKTACVGYAGGCFRHCRIGRLEIFASDPFGLNDGLAPDAPAAFRLFDGQASVGREFHHSLAASAGMARMIDAAVEGRLTPEAVNAGVFVLGRIDAQGLRLVTDPLSQYPVYLVRRGAGFMISNVLAAIVALLRRHGLPATPSLLPCLEGMVMGGSLGEGTPVEEIERLSFGCDIEAGDTLRLTPRPALDMPLDYEATIRAARAALAAHVDAVAAAVATPRLVVADVSGGVDSRCVLSLLLESPLRDELAGRCFTRFPNPDANVAGAIMERFGLPVARLPTGIDIGRLMQPEPAVPGAVLSNAAFSGGARVVEAAPPAIAFPHLVHFTGAFGELGGGSSSADFVALAGAGSDPGGYSAERAVDIILDRRRKVGATGLLHPDALAQVRRNAIACLAALEATGVPRDQLSAELYLRVRCRDHFGLASRVGSIGRVRPDPLASAWLVRARRLLPSALHRRNKVILDLMLAGGETSRSLAMMPLAGKRWEAPVLPAGLVPDAADIEPVGPDTPALSRLTGALMAGEMIPTQGSRGLLHEHAVRLKVKEALQRSREAPPPGNVRFGNEAAIQGHQALMRGLVERLPAGHTAWQAFDRAAVLRCATQPLQDFRSTIDSGALSHAVAGLTWLLDQPGVEAPAELLHHPAPAA
ncbi:hypothetical protein BKE38_11055 [Pseudoroseomonas deserti]|uniref:Asparagine synthetase domain-containing protein n=1 Tax=Teichococcus deserti TaxID=1817963 RepID=A0A1V2H2L5_9PROT|nr:hypothetical protein [Pseudoroseomonas deserti]ONG54006.1 hypothetical protein BKE38_11055 [Pseudoroseomonas deserti]